MQVELPQVIRTAKQLYHAFKIDTDSFEETLTASALQEFAPDVRLATARDGFSCFCIDIPQLLASLSPKLRDQFPVRGAQFMEVSCRMGILHNEKRVYFRPPGSLFDIRAVDQIEWYIAEVSLAMAILQYLDTLGVCATNKVPKEFRDRIRKVYCEYLEERFP